jgi:hypothetical protein
MEKKKWAIGIMIFLIIAIAVAIFIDVSSIGMRGLM